jgi:chorismate dehydratase
LALNSTTRLRVAAIRFLNPAPLMWDFDHPPRAAALAQRYDVHYTQPSLCADEILANRADLGLIPVASLTPELAIVPGCAIASLDCVRSIQLIVKLKSNDGKRKSNHSESNLDEILRSIRSIAADTASRSSLAYAQILFRTFLSTDPQFIPAAADPIAMLTGADAALLIGDPALLALEDRAAIEAHPGIGPCLWVDLAHEWRTRTGTPWVAAVWAVRPQSLTDSTITPAQLIDDLQHSRDNGLAHIDILVDEWTSRIALPSSTIREYLTHNIHYTLTTDCLAAIRLFRRLADEAGVLPALSNLCIL